MKLVFFVALALSLGSVVNAADTFRVAAYNVENYIDQPGTGRAIKSADAKAKVRESILAMKPDVISFEEMGGTNAFLELRESLKKDGLDYPHWEHITSYDTNIHVAVLSKFPFTARHPHTNDNFLLAGKKFRVKRGFAELDIKVNDNYSFTLLAAHLKSKIASPMADQDDERLQEATILREKIDARLKADPNVNLIVLGDFNDFPNSKPVKEIIGTRGKNQLVDTRPAERNNDTPSVATGARHGSRSVAWTHFYGTEDTYSRLDYILLSHGMAKELVAGETYIPTIPNWGIGSDHRPIVATFEAVNK